MLESASERFARKKPQAAHGAEGHEPLPAPDEPPEEPLPEGEHRP
jgi:hypothetical protein